MADTLNLQLVIGGDASRMVAAAEAARAAVGKVKDEAAKASAPVDTLTDALAGVGSAAQAGAAAAESDLRQLGAAAEEVARAVDRARGVAAGGASAAAGGSEVARRVEADQETIRARWR